MTDADSKETFVSWQVDGIDVNATLTRPDGEGPFPAAIMVAGSGPTDRDWNSPLIPGTNGSGRLFAQALTGAGYVTLRYDKRASGPQGNENAVRMAGKISMQGHIDELAGGVKLLAGRHDVDPQRIFALTNSEGCIHALNYQIEAAGTPFTGLVLTSAPARPVGEVARGQIAAQLTLVPDGDRWLAVYDAAMADFSAGRPVQVGEDFPDLLRTVLLGVTNPINQPFARELWVTEPAALLSRVSVPILIVIGKKDIQVDWHADGAIFEAAAKTRENITVAYAENANHVLKYEPRDLVQLTPTDVMMTYSGDGVMLDTDSAALITKWLTAH